MFRFKALVLVSALLATGGFASAQTASKYPGLGRDATPKEVKAWDIDVRPDFTGLPPGSGSVAKGQEVWEGKCASCHGVFGESGEVFNPLVGGTTADDIKTGHASKLKDPTGGRTTLMKVATLSTIWDYINRAMPWTQPKSLTTEEVYAVTAFLLSLGEIVPADFVLSDKNIADVQKRMPNRDGMTTKHSLWPGKEFGGVAKPDTHNVACMSNCETETKVSSFLPEFARNAHGNLAEQNRLVGPQHGADTSKPEGKSLGETRTVAEKAVVTGEAAANGAAAAPAKAASPADAKEAPTSGAAAPKAAATPAPAAKDSGAAAPKAAPAAAPATPTKPAAAAPAGHDNAAAIALTKKNNCVACHAMDTKLVGPAFSAIAKKHAGKTDYLAGKIKAGSTGVWGAIPMPPQSLSESDAKTIAAWLAAGGGK